MAHSTTYVRRRTEFVWPLPQVAFWTILILVTAGTILGVFASFIQVQNRLGLGIPWIMPYGLAVGVITVVFVIIMLLLLNNDNLQPGIVILISFMMFVLYMTGLVDTGLQVFGQGEISSNCNKYVNNNPTSGLSTDTLAWLEQNNICSSWYAAFSFWLIGAIFFVWMFIMASQVGNGAFVTRR